jgi:predicted DNA-binding transcriptional regulator AlpA
MSRLIRLPEVMYRLGIIDSPDPAAARRRAPTFHRHYRYHPAFPKPVDTPEGKLTYRASEVDEFIAECPHEGDSRPRVEVAQ